MLKKLKHYALVALHWAVVAVVFVVGGAAVACALVGFLAGYAVLGVLWFVLRHPGAVAVIALAYLLVTAAR